MKLLFDENLPFSLVRRLADVFPESRHVRDVGLKATDDALTWEYAKTNGCIVVSKDSDYADRSVLYGHPPKVVGVRLGNCRAQAVADLLRRHSATLHTFANDPTAAFLPIA